MPQRPSHIPNYRERIGLQLLVNTDWLPAASLHPAGPSTIVRLLGKGWVERKQDATFGWAYRITGSGQAAIKALIPSKARRSAGKLKANASKLWTKEADERLRELALSGLRASEIGTQLGRTADAIKNRVHKLRKQIKRVNVDSKRKGKAAGSGSV
jgi:hypothetical protein